MNWLGRLCEKLAGVKDGEIVKKSIFLGDTHAGGMGGLCWKPTTDLNPGNVVGKYI